MPGEEEHDNHMNGPLKPYFSGGGEDSAASYANMDVAVGAEVGPFKLLGILGEGGYGIVYLAEQERPIRRRVALKIVKPGMDSRQVITRFQAEQQALAVLDHPNIAHIHDAGTTPTGRPYFAMELIEGRPITEHCDRERLSLRERLRLFSQVCSAVRHAHQKGILHRDLKPSNVLVATQDGEPLVKVIDFGIAKALAQPLTDRSLHTEQGQFIGTPDYMSPEQAEMDARGVDTRSDVYSLGVILYELLIGVLPFDPDALRNGGPQNVRRTIRQQEPKTPSTRLTAMGDEIARIAERRQTDPQTLARSLRRELEWIPLKAMRKDPSRRYQAVSELAADIENYLRGNPLLAGPESVAYLATKFVQRHRGAVAATLTVAASLLIALIVSVEMYFKAENARDEAVRAQGAEQQQRELADFARAEAEKRLADLYENEGRSYLASGEYDKALVLLSEAYELDRTRPSVRLSLLEGLRKHGDPNLRQIGSLTLWRGLAADQNLPSCVSPLRTLAAFVDSTANAVYIQRTDTGEQVNRLHVSNVLNLAFTPDDRHIIAKTRQGQGYHAIKAFSVRNGEEIISIDRQEVDIHTVQQLAGEHPPERKQLETTYNGILISPTGGWFAFIDAGGALEDLKPRACLWDFAAHAFHVEEEEFVGQFILGYLYRIPSAFDGYEALMIVDRERVVHFLAVPDLKFQSRFPFGVTSTMLSADGMRFLISLEPSGVDLGDRSNNRTIKRFLGMKRYGFSPDSKYVVTERTVDTDADDDASLVRIDVWDARDGRHVADLRSTAIENLHFAPDSRLVVTEHKNHGLKVWSTKDFTATFAIPAGEQQVTADMSTDGRWLLTRSWDDAGLIRLYDLENGRFFEPYDCSTAPRDLSEGWAGVTMGRVFSSSFAQPRQLPLFSNGGAHIITASGLWPFLKDTSEFQAVRALVAAHIPLRLENANLRAASPRDMLHAKAEYARLRGGSEVLKAIRYQLQIVEQQRASGHLDQALDLWISEIPSRTTLDLATAGYSDEVVHRLYDDLLLRGELCEYQGRYALALSDYRTAVTLAETDLRAYKKLVWLLATCPDTTLRNGREAVESARRVHSRMQADEWEWSALYAAVCAADGDWLSAIAYQEKAIVLLPEEEKGRWVPNYQERLRWYQSGRSYAREGFLDLGGNDLVARWDFEEPRAVGILPMSFGSGHVPLNWSARSLGTPHGRVLKFWDDCGYADCGPLQLRYPIVAITVTAWARWEDVQKQNWHPTVASWGGSWTLYRNPGTGTVAFGCDGLAVPSSAPYSYVLGETPLVDDDRWHHFAGVYDGTRLQIYLDGVLDGNAEATGTIPSFERSVWAGMGTSVATSWTGMVDDVRVYAVVLSADEIAGLYRQGRTRYEGSFFIDAGDLQTVILPTGTIRLQARISTNGGTLPADQLRISWTQTAGPPGVHFLSRESVPDPWVTFSDPGVHSFRCTVGSSELQAYDEVSVVVYPDGFAGLVAHYTFDDGTAGDSSGQRINGVLKGDACIVSDPERGNVLSLDGNGDYVDCGADPRFDVNRVLTVAAWIKVVSVDGYSLSIVSKGDSAWGLYRNRSTDRVRFACGGMDGFETWPGPIGATPVYDHCWHHVAGVCDGTKMILYVDGRQDASVGMPGDIRVNGEPVYIGGNAEVGLRWWNGLIDDVRIYCRALDAEEIARLFEETK
jgi:serine/threonine protein kinase/WD40 repeat protein